MLPIKQIAPLCPAFIEGTSMPISNSDVYQTITDRIIVAIETSPGRWQRPWSVRSGGRRPANIASGHSYRGINTLALWAEAQLSGYNSHVWGSYRQWAALGCQVRKGEKASSVVFFKEIPFTAAESDEAQTQHARLFARATPVFNADQVDGLPAAPIPAGTTINLPSVDHFVQRLGADIVHGGDQACYMTRLDVIRMREREAFIGTATSTATESYYGTLAHELTHWTAPNHRCGRDLHKRFSRDAYAMEELVAELGAAFLCADLGIANEDRADHAQYLAHWLRVLKSDKRAIFTAASKAAQAVAFMTDRATGVHFRPLTRTSEGSSCRQAEGNQPGRGPL